MPQLRSLQDKYRKQLVILGVNAGEEVPSRGSSAAKQHQLNYPVLLRGDQVMEQYGASGFPTNYLIDPAGRIVEAQVGADPKLWSRVEAIVSRFQPPDEPREGTGGPRRASQITRELTFPLPPGPREWIVGGEVVIRFERPEGIQADLVSLSVDGKQIAAFGVGRPYTWNAAELSNGPHTLRLAAQTASGRETWATEQVVIVDNRPTLPDNAPRTAASGAPQGWTRYRSTTLGVAVTVPSGWKQSTDGAAPNGFAMNGPQGQTLQVTRRRMSKAHSPGSLKNNLPGYEDAREETIGGRPGLVRPGAGAGGWGVEAAVPVDRWLYTITLDAPGSAPTQALAAEFTRILNGLRFTSPTTARTTR